jgi:coenzyme PQQ precursor peptide PqqA
MVHADFEIIRPSLTSSFAALFVAAAVLGSSASDRTFVLFAAASVSLYRGTCAAGRIDGFSSRVIRLRSALGSRRSEVSPCDLHEKRNDNMAWSTPEVREVCVGMEVTSYLSAEM